jgi:hypothetical protein
MKPVTKCRIWNVVASFAIVLLLLAFPDLAPSHSAERTVINLREYGFPPDLDIKLGVFYLSSNRLLLFFDQRLPDAGPQSHAIRLIVLNSDGEATAQLVVRGDPEALDLTVGPDGGVLSGREGKLDFYDSKLQLQRSIPLPAGTTGIRFDRQRDQLVIVTVDRQSGQRTAHFRSGKTLEESAALSYPIKSYAVFGENQVVYTTTGKCEGAAHVVSNQVSWRLPDKFPTCSPLVFVTRETLAFAVDGQMFVVDSNGKKLLQVRIPAPGTFESPRFVGLSDDGTRLAISALQRKETSSGWPYYDEVFVYDLVSKRMIFRHALQQGSVSMALSPDGHQLATIESGIRTVMPVP